MSGNGIASPALERRAGRRGQLSERAGVLDLQSDLLGGWVRVTAPDPATPFWREQDVTRHSYGSLRCGLERGSAIALREAQLEAIGRIARAALAASDRDDQGETARLAMAAGRLCQEIAGHWPPSAVEVPRR